MGAEVIKFPRELAQHSLSVVADHYTLYTLASLHHCQDRPRTSWQRVRINSASLPPPTPLGRCSLHGHDVLWQGPKGMSPDSLRLTLSTCSNLVTSSCHCYICQNLKCLTYKKVVSWSGWSSWSPAGLEQQGMIASSTFVMQSSAPKSILLSEGLVIHGHVLCWYCKTLT